MHSIKPSPGKIAVTIYQIQYKQNIKQFYIPLLTNLSGTIYKQIHTTIPVIARLDSDSNTTGKAIIRVCEDSHREIRGYAHHVIETLFQPTQLSQGSTITSG